MAKVLSHMHSSIRGKVGGVVYSKNQYAGIIMRAFSAPTNPQTEGQETIRSSFDVANIEWEALTLVNRQLWDDYAKTVQYQGPHGAYTVPGRTLFMATFSLAAFLEAIGGSSILPGVLPPLAAGRLNIGPIVEGTYTQAGKTGVAVNVGNPSAIATCLLAQRSIGWQTTKNVFYGPYPFTYNQAEDIASPGTTPVEMETGPGTVGQIFFVRVRAILEQAPHKFSIDTQVRCTAVAVP